MTNLFDPITLRKTTFQNRVWVSPMCQYKANDGLISEWHFAHLNAFATGAPGLIMVEATGVVPEGRISVGCTGIWSDEQAKAFKPIINFAHSQNVKIGIQLAHAGRKLQRCVLGMTIKWLQQMKVVGKPFQLRHLHIARCQYHAL